MTNERYLGTTIDNPPTSEPEYESAIGQAINHLRHGRKVPYDIAQELMAQGYDLPSLTAAYQRIS